jgi:predicted glycogen debranching enzyme
MERVIRRIDLRNAHPATLTALLRREWLATNGRGGYASATIANTVTWRYHGLLISALPEPFGRFAMLNHLAECLVLPDGQTVPLVQDEPNRTDEPNRSAKYLVEFRLEEGLPIWVYDVEGIVIQKHVLLLHGQNTVHISYHLVSGQQDLKLQLRPSVHFRGHEQPVGDESVGHYRLFIDGERYEVRAGESMPSLRLVARAEHSSFTYDGGSRRELFYPKEADRGFSSRAWVWSPGHFDLALHPKCSATLIASTEAWHTMLAIGPAEAVKFHKERARRLLSIATPEARTSPAADLVLAADTFIVTPAGRLQEAARAHAAGDEVRTVIAGYHWFTDWGRDTMISLEGLTLTTRRYTEAAWILRTFAHAIRDGLIPNLFPEGQHEGLYHTADATLWFFHALNRYVEVTGDRETLRSILPKLIDIVEHHLGGTRFGIRVDAQDGLLTQGASGYQLTWMDAKVEDWVVTPRRGKAVEINGLWYNALRLLETWLKEEGRQGEARKYTECAQRAFSSFNSRFWYAAGRYLYDVIDGENGDDSACRPNQVLSFSLRHPVLQQQYWQPVLQVVRNRLLTPVGLRSLDPEHPDYKSKYFGDLRARDAAYHQGTVWAWLIGPYVDAWLRVYPEDRAGAHALVQGLAPHLDQACIGSISEIFDADPPFSPRGCIAQAWSVAETLRCWVKTAPPNSAKTSPGAQPVTS